MEKISRFGCVKFTTFWTDFWKNRSLTAIIRNWKHDGKLDVEKKKNKICSEENDKDENLSVCCWLQKLKYKWINYCKINLAPHSRILLLLKRIFLLLGLRYFPGRLRVFLFCCPLHIIMCNFSSLCPSSSTSLPWTAFRLPRQPCFSVLREFSCWWTPLPASFAWSSWNFSRCILLLRVSFYA